MLVEWMNMCVLAQSARQKRKALLPYLTHLSPVLDLVKSSDLNVTVVHFFSDGPSTQYRQKGNFYLFCTKLKQYGFQSGTWNFLEASHGKGAPDGIGGFLKRTADGLVSHGKDIPNAELLFGALLDVQMSVKLFYISEENMDEAVKNMPNNLPVVPSTMRIHHVVTLTPGQIIYRDVSCLCSARQTMKCQCYNSPNLYLRDSGNSIHRRARVRIHLKFLGKTLTSASGAVRTYQPKIYWLYYNHKINAQLFLQQDHKMGKFNQYQDTTDGLIKPVAHIYRCVRLHAAPHRPITEVATCRQGRS